MNKEIFINESMGETRIAIQENNQLVEVYVEKQDQQRMVGNIYKGKWIQNKMHGLGEMNYSNGDKYEGEWKDGMMHGQGTFYYKNGYKYVILGHIHTPKIESFDVDGDEIIYMNSGDWLESLSSLEYVDNKWSIYNSFEWFTTGNFSINLGYFVDNITAIMLVVVSLIGFLVHLYSTEYMKDDSKYSRYFAFLGIFIFSMNGIVLADSLIMIYVFWELVGLSSFLLIGFWFEKEKPPLAANKAFLTNRVGDIGMFIAVSYTHLRAHETDS